jgi:hypothetical protein
MLATMLLVYAGDYLSLRYQIPGGRAQFGQISIDTLWAIHEKNGKTTYEDGQPEVDRCVRSLFPHYGSKPCRYTSRHTEQRIDI